MSSTLPKNWEGVLKGRADTKSDGSVFRKINELETALLRLSKVRQKNVCELQKIIDFMKSDKVKWTTKWLKIGGIFCRTVYTASMAVSIFYGNRCISLVISYAGKTLEGISKLRAFTANEKEKLSLDKFLDADSEATKKASQCYTELEHHLYNEWKVPSLNYGVWLKQVPLKEASKVSAFNTKNSTIKKIWEICCDAKEKLDKLPMADILPKVVSLITEGKVEGTLAIIGNVVLNIAIIGSDICDLIENDLGGKKALLERMEIATKELKLDEQMINEVINRIKVKIFLATEYPSLDVKLQLLQIELEDHRKCDYQKLSKAYIQLADEIDGHRKKTSIAKIIGSSTGLIGFGMGVAGVIAAPFTSGISLGLVIAGIATAGAGGLTTGGASIAGHFLEKIPNDVLKSYNEHQERFKRLQIICALVYEQLKKEGYNDDMVIPNTHLTVSDVKAIISLLCRLSFIGCIVFAVAGNTGRLGTKVISQGLETMGKTALRGAPHASRVVSLVGIGVGVLGAAIDIYTIVDSSIDIHKKVSPQAAKDLKAMAEYFKQIDQKEIENVIGNILNRLKDEWTVEKSLSKLKELQIKQD